MIRKTPDLASRLSAASTKKAAALATFEEAAASLEAVADEHLALADEANTKAAEFAALALTAEQDAEHASRAASKVRDLFA